MTDPKMGNTSANHNYADEVADNFRAVEREADDIDRRVSETMTNIAKGARLAPKSFRL